MCRVRSPTWVVASTGDTGPRVRCVGVGHAAIFPRVASPAARDPGSLECGHGPADLRDRERVRHHVHVRGSAPPDARRGGALPLPQGRLVGPLVQRVPLQRQPALPRRRLPPRVRHPRVRPRPPARRPRQGGGADHRGPRGRRPGPARRGGHRGRDLRLQEQHRLRRQLLRLPRELPRGPGGGVPAALRRAHPVPRQPPDHLWRRQGRHDVQGRDLLRQPAGRPHLGGRLVGDHPQPPHHQHPRRAARRRRALPPPARHRRRLQHERDDHDAQGRVGRPRAADDRGRHGRARPHPGEPDPGDPRDEPRHDRPQDGPAVATGASCPRCRSRASTSSAPRPSPTARASRTRSTSRSSTCGSAPSAPSTPATCRWSTPRSTGSSSTS